MLAFSPEPGSALLAQNQSSLGGDVVEWWVMAEDDLRWRGKTDTAGWVDYASDRPYISRSGWNLKKSEQFQIPVKMAATFGQVRRMSECSSPFGLAPIKLNNAH